MSSPSDKQVNPELIEQARRQVNRLAEEIAHLSETEMEPHEYYGEFLQRVLSAIAAPAGAVWMRTPQGNLQLQYQIRMREVGLDQTENGRQVHDELLRQAITRNQPSMLAPQSGLGEPAEGGLAPGNPTNFVVLIAPILVEKQVAGLVEVWQEPQRGPDAQRGFLQFIMRMAQLASSYMRNHQLRQMSSQQQVWTQLEAFAKSVHGSLSPVEVAYNAANEGKRLIECDRVSIGLREGGKAVVRAISGADVIERRSNLVVLMRQLFQEVLKWGEKLTYTGAKDEALPPAVLRALDNYLEESNSKVLMVTPLRDPREKNPKKPARSVLMIESFEPMVTAEQLNAKLEVVAKHATPALYNAWEYRRIPFRFIWYPLAKIQEGLGGKAKAIVLAITFALVALLTIMVVVPYPLKMDAKGELQPKKQRWIYAPMAGHVVHIDPALESGKSVTTGMGLLTMYSSDLEGKIRELKRTIRDANGKIKIWSDQLAPSAKSQDQSFLTDLRTKLDEARATYSAKRNELSALQSWIRAVPGKDGFFRLRPPINGILLTSDFRKVLINKFVQPNEPLLQIGGVPEESNSNEIKREDVLDPEKWVIELKIPQKHIGQVLAAYQSKDLSEELDVDFLLVSRPTQVFRGRLARKDIASQAIPDRTANDEAEAVVLAKVRLSPIYDDQGKPDIAKEQQMPAYLLRSGTEAHARVRCGYHPMGYSLFYGVWEFFYEKVVFFF